MMALSSAVTAASTVMELAVLAVTVTHALPMSTWRPTSAPAGGGLEHIVKQLGSAGTGDPLNQRASVGWKATKVAVRLDDSAIRRIETCSTYTE